MTGPHHAVFGLTTPNLGDDLQALTVAMHSPIVSRLIHREAIGSRQTEAKHLLVMNYWFMSKGISVRTARKRGTIVSRILRRPRRAAQVSLAGLSQGACADQLP